MTRGYSKTVHVWEKIEVVLQAQNAYGNSYTEVEVWVDLQGPGFEKRVYGFWDGGNTFKVRVLATTPRACFRIPNPLSRSSRPP